MLILFLPSLACFCSVAKSKEIQCFISLLTRSGLPSGTVLRLYGAGFGAWTFKSYFQYQMKSCRTLVYFTTIGGEGWGGGVGV